MTESCLYCGTDINQFLLAGKFGCANCYSIFWIHPRTASELKDKKNWGMSQSQNKSYLRLNPFSQDSESNFQIDLNLQNTTSLFFSARYRVARNLEKSFFLPNTKYNNRVRNLLTNHFPNLIQKESLKNSSSEIEIWSLTEQYVLFEQNISNFENTEILVEYQFRIGDEDQIRLEIIIYGQISKKIISIDELEKIKKSLTDSPIYRQILAFMMNRRIWAFHKKWGFLTSCPTNVGRGDRFSLIISREKVALSEPGQQRDWIKRGFGIEIAKYSIGSGEKFYYFSVKNFNRRRKYYFLQSILSLVF